MKSSDPFWTENIHILFAKERLLEFWPSYQLSFHEQTNACSRFMLYAGILLSIANTNSTYMFISFILVITLAIVVKSKPMRQMYHDKSGNFETKQSMIDKKCTKPTDENPFGNILMNEYQDNPQRKPACDASDVKAQVKDAFFSDFVQDPFDVFNRKHSQRQFFSTANTSIPNNQDAFAQWLYGKEGKTCKEKALMCKGNEAFA